MSERERLNRVLERLAALADGHAEGRAGAPGEAGSRRVLGGAQGHDDLLRQILCEIDVTILARRLVFENDRGDSLEVEAANRRLFTLPRIDESLGRGDLAGRTISEEDAEQLQAVLALLRALAADSGSIVVRAAASAAPPDHGDVGCSSEALAAAAGIALWPEAPCPPLAPDRPEPAPPAAPAAGTGPTPAPAPAAGPDGAAPNGAQDATPRADGAAPNGAHEDSARSAQEDSADTAPEQPAQAREGADNTLVSRFLVACGGLASAAMIRSEGNASPIYGNRGAQAALLELAGQDMQTLCGRIDAVFATAARRPTLSVIHSGGGGQAICHVRDREFDGFLLVAPDALPDLRALWRSLQAG